MQSVAKALEFLHAAAPPVVARLTPASVLMDASFSVVRVRVDVTNQAAAAAAASASAAAAASDDGAVVSPDAGLWTAPEAVFSPASAQPAADIYAFGLLLYEIFSGHQAYKAELRAIEKRGTAVFRSPLEDLLLRIMDADLRPGFARPRVSTAAPGVRRSSSDLDSSKQRSRLRGMPEPLRQLARVRPLRGRPAALRARRWWRAPSSGSHACAGRPRRTAGTATLSGGPPRAR